MSWYKISDEGSSGILHTTLVTHVKKTEVIETEAVA